MRDGYPETVTLSALGRPPCLLGARHFNRFRVLDVVCPGGAVRPAAWQIQDSNRPESGTEIRLEKPGTCQESDRAPRV